MVRSGAYAWDAVNGRVIASTGVTVLEEAARITGDEALGAEAEQLRAAIQQFRSGYLRGLSALDVLGAHPADPAVLEWLGDESLPPALRRGLLFSLLFGFCYNPREILFGIDRQRHDALDRAREALDDLPRSDELVALYRRGLVSLGQGLPGREPRGAGIIVMRALGLSGLFKRVTGCASS